MASPNMPAGLAGFLTSRDRFAQEQNNELAQASTVMNLRGVLQKAAKEKAFRDDLAALGPNPTQEALATVASRHSAPDVLLRTHQSSLDRAAAAEKTKAMRDATIAQQKYAADLMHQTRLAQARTDAERAQETARHNKVLEGIQQQITDIRRDQPTTGPSLSEVVDPTDKTRMLRIDARQYKGGGLGSPGVIGISGKEPVAAKRDEAKGQGKEQISTITDAIAADYGILQKRGDLVDPKNSAVGNIWERAAASGVGQTVAGFVGTEAQAVRDRINNAKPLLMAAIKQATGMTAQQLNSNAELQFYLQAATDVKMGYDTNIAALAVLDESYGTGTGVKANPEAMAALKRLAEQRFGVTGRVGGGHGGGFTDPEKERRYQEWKARQGR